jgi:hypothetical protein
MILTRFEVREGSYAKPTTRPLVNPDQEIRRLARLCPPPLCRTVIRPVALRPPEETREERSLGEA